MSAKSSFCYSLPTFNSFLSLLTNIFYRIQVTREIGRHVYSFTTSHRVSVHIYNIEAQDAQDHWTHPSVEICWSSEEWLEEDEHNVPTTPYPVLAQGTHFGSLAWENRWFDIWRRLTIRFGSWRSVSVRLGWRRHFTATCQEIINLASVYIAGSKHGDKSVRGRTSGTEIVPLEFPSALKKHLKSRNGKIVLDALRLCESLTLYPFTSLRRYFFVNPFLLSRHLLSMNSCRWGYDKNISWISTRGLDRWFSVKKPFNIHREEDMEESRLF